SPGPLQREEYAVDYGSGVAGPKPKGGLRVETTEKEFRIVHPSDLEFTVSRNPPGVLSQVRAGIIKYLNPESTGLIMRTKSDDVHKWDWLGIQESKVVKDGPLAVTLQFRAAEVGTPPKFQSGLRMDFPISKSWVRVDWTFEDPNGEIIGLGAEWNLNVQGEP